MTKKEAYNNLVAVANDTNDKFYTDWVSNLPLNDNKALKLSLLSLMMCNNYNICDATQNLINAIGQGVIL